MHIRWTVAQNPVTSYPHRTPLQSLPFLEASQSIVGPVKTMPLRSTSSPHSAQSQVQSVNMLLSTALFLFGGANAVSARLWGWEDEFTIVVRTHMVDAPPDSFQDPLNHIPVDNPKQVLEVAQRQSCPGWGTWCSESCRELQTYHVTGNHVDKSQAGHWEQAVTKMTYDWARVERDKSAWIDLWRRDDDGTFDMYEADKDAPPQGFCKVPPNPGKDGPPQTKCGDSDLDTVISLVCYQY